MLPPYRLFRLTNMIMMAAGRPIPHPSPCGTWTSSITYSAWILLPNDISPLYLFPSAALPTIQTWHTVLRMCRPRFYYRCGQLSNEVGVTWYSSTTRKRLLVSLYDIPTAQCIM